MPQTEQTLVTFLLDRTGSMESCKAATIEGFNGYLNGLRQDDDGQIRFTLLQFDSQSLDKIVVAVPLSAAPELTEDNYQPRASTPLIDAAFKTIKAVEEAVATSGGNPKVVICIQTDGHENCSCEHTMEELRGLIERRTQEGWQFNFMGAGIDAYAQAAVMGISGQSTMSYDHTDARTTREAFAASAENTRSYAKGQSMNTNYSSGQRAAAGDRFAVNQPDLTPAAAPAPQPPQTPPQTPPAQTLPRATRKVVSDFKL